MTDHGLADATVIVADAVDAEFLELVESESKPSSGPDARTLVVLGAVRDSDVIELVQAGALGLLRRHEAAGGVLVSAVRATARAQPTMSPEFMAVVLSSMSGAGPDQHALTEGNLSEREAMVLRLIADGYDTVEIAEELCYSQRTVKNILHSVTERLRLRNRSHAVAFALRKGLI